ncbi:MAG: chorismate mutase [Clostridiales bacterium]|nr:chorismate mutase [Clostridiales bacterium]
MDIAELRKEIDKTDDEIVKLFEKRMNTVLEIAKYKVRTGMKVLDNSREKDILNRVSKEVPEDMAEYVKTLFSTLFSLSRSYQRSYINKETKLSQQIETALKNTGNELPQSARVACQGVPGAYSQIACGRIFNSPNIEYFKGFRNVFEAVEKGICDYGILPIENSLYGSVVNVYDLMREYKFSIVSSTKIRVDHCLLTSIGTDLKDIKEIFSHEQAIGQCGRFIDSLGDIKITVCENTAVAAKLVADSKRLDAAAISSAECADIYGLNLLKKGIQNADNNYTKFICISKDTEIYPGADNISFMMTLPHRPGSLFEIMSDFAALGLNLTKLESRPIVGSDFEFMFYFVLEASVISKDVVSLLNDLNSRSGQFVFLGNYTEK